MNRTNLIERKYSSSDKLRFDHNDSNNENKRNKLIFSESYKNCIENYLVKTVLNRKYFSNQIEFNNHVEKKKQEMINLIENINKNIIGNDATFITPFGLFTHNETSILITYCDYIASGKPLEFIEDYLRNEVFMIIG